MCIFSQNKKRLESLKEALKTGPSDLDADNIDLLRLLHEHFISCELPNCHVPWCRCLSLIHQWVCVLWAHCLHSLVFLYDSPVSMLPVWLTSEDVSLDLTLVPMFWLTSGLPHIYALMYDGCVSEYASFHVTVFFDVHVSLTSELPHVHVLVYNASVSMLPLMWPFSLMFIWWLTSELPHIHALVYDASVGMLPLMWLFSLVSMFVSPVSMRSLI